MSYLRREVQRYHERERTAGWVRFELTAPLRVASVFGTDAFNHSATNPANYRDDDDERELARRAGFEPATNRLTAECSASELPSHEYTAATPCDAAVRFSGPLKSESTSSV